MCHSQRLSINIRIHQAHSTNGCTPQQQSTYLSVSSSFSADKCVSRLQHTAPGKCRMLYLVRTSRNPLSDMLRACAHLNLVRKLVWTALPMPSMMTRSAPAAAPASTSGTRLRSRHGLPWPLATMYRAPGLRQSRCLSFCFQKLRTTATGHVKI